MQAGRRGESSPQHFRQLVLIGVARGVQVVGATLQGGGGGDDRLLMQRDVFNAALRLSLLRLAIALLFFQQTQPLAGRTNTAHVQEKFNAHKCSCVGIPGTGARVPVTCITRAPCIAMLLSMRDTRPSLPGMTLALNSTRSFRWILSFGEASRAARDSCARGSACGAQQKGSRNQTTDTARGHSARSQVWVVPGWLWEAAWQGAPFAGCKQSKIGFQLSEQAGIAVASSSAKACGRATFLRANQLYNAAATAT